MTMAAWQDVKTSTRLLSQEVAQVEAMDALDFAGPGVAGVAALAEKRQPWWYEFSNGRRFNAPKDPYA